MADCFVSVLFHVLVIIARILTNFLSMGHFIVHHIMVGLLIYLQSFSEYSFVSQWKVTELHCEENRCVLCKRVFVSFILDKKVFEMSNCATVINFTVVPVMEVIWTCGYNAGLRILNLVARASRT